MSRHHARDLTVCSLQQCQQHVLSALEIVRKRSRLSLRLLQHPLQSTRPAQVPLSHALRTRRGQRRLELAQQRIEWSRRTQHGRRDAFAFANQSDRDVQRRHIVVAQFLGQVERILEHVECTSGDGTASGEAHSDVLWAWRCISSCDVQYTRPLEALSCNFAMRSRLARMRRLTFLALVAVTGSAAACTRAAPVNTPVSASATPAGGPSCCAAEAKQIAERYRVAAIANRRFTHEQLWAALDPLTRAPGIRVREIGRSVQGRAIRAVTFGRGPTTVLLWSQMHGDEATATMSLADMLAWMGASGGERDVLRQRLDSLLTIVMVPMLNPDGAELFQRENAIGIDVNRDARRLVTPEARALKSLRDSINPAYGFNLHDQNARTLAGPRGPQVAIALLAPAAEATGAYGPTRTDARLVAAEIATVLRGEIGARVAKYNDAFEPRAFGDLMQQWGTRTVLIESGALPDDVDKQKLRAVNVIALLSALDAIATGRYRAADAAAYESLPSNARVANDVFIRGGTLVMPGSPPMRVDLTIAYEDPVARLRPRVRDVGDVASGVALDTIDASGLFLHPDASALVERGGRRWLRIDAAANIAIRRGADASSALVRMLGVATPAP